MPNLVKSVFERENGIRSHHNVSPFFTENFFASRYIMARIAHRCFVERPTTCMTFNNDGELIYATFGRNFLLYDWEMKKEQNIFVSPEFGYFSEMKCQNSSKSDINIISVCLNNDRSDKKIMQTCIDPSGNVSFNTIFQGPGLLSSDPLRFALVPENRNEVMLGSEGNISTLDLRCAPYSYLDPPSNVFILDENGGSFEIENIIHHPFNPEVSVYGYNCEIHVFDKRNYKVALRKICVGYENHLRSFKRNISYNYNGLEFLAQRSPQELCLMSNTDKGGIIRSFKGILVYRHESCFYGPKSTHIIGGACIDCCRTPSINIQDKNTGELVGGTSSRGGYHSYYQSDFQKEVSKGPCMFSHPTLPVFAFLGKRTGIEIFSVPNINFTNKIPEIEPQRESNLMN